DKLLEQLRDEEVRAARGRLRIYFGSSAGVGKTYAMLNAGRKLLADGVDVVAGVIETHGRIETAAQVGALPVLPMAAVPYRDRTLAEFDLDGALARHPALLLVDELAHSNVAGSRHPKRWQDVEELLDAGIDVWSTLNVQHLESLNDVVGGIAGIRVHETLPDTFFDRADEVVLVDTPADELLARLEAGKVYVPEQAERAGRNFFRKGNLMALRELALRRTADRVEDDVQAYRVDRSIDRVWKTEAALLCCIGPRGASDHLVRSAARMAQQLAVAWHAVYVETPSLQRLPNAERDRILRTVKLAEELGATTAVLTGQDVASALVEHARRYNLSKLLMGHDRPRPLWRRYTFSQRMARLAPDVDLIEIGQPQASDVAPLRGRPLPGGAGGVGGVGGVGSLDGLDSPDRVTVDPHRSHTRYLWAVAACFVTTLVAWPLRDTLDPTNIVMLYLLAVVGVAARFGRGPAVLSAVLNVVAFDFTFVAPQMSLAVSDVQYLLTFGVMLVVGLTIGQLTGGLRFQARVATSRESRSRALFEVSRQLSSVLVTEQVVAIAESSIAQEFKAKARLFLLDKDETLRPPTAAGAPGDASSVFTGSGTGSSAAPRPFESTSRAGPGASIDAMQSMQSMQSSDATLDLGTARWSLDHDAEAGLGTDTLPGSAWLYLPLKAPMRTRGVLAIQPQDPRLLMIPEQRRQLETFVLLVAIALERVHYVEVAQKATVQMESERLRSGLLSALSHDLRTPLSAIYGMAGMLVDDSAGQSPRLNETAMSIAASARRMKAMVDNLLDMARLQSGPVQLHLQWQPLEEVVGSSLAAMDLAMASHIVRTELPADLPLVRFDAVLVERVLCNLLENAAKYTPSGSVVTIAAAVRAGDLLVTVSDDGPGLPPGREEALFEKFARGQKESTTPGVGLGLAICRAIVEAHGGRIWVEPAVPATGPRYDVPSNQGMASGEIPLGQPDNRHRGATFRFTLPLGTPPEMPMVEEITAP
ncbi:MAG: two-component regulatory protein sensor kinase, partial [Rhizobacter sp.]|nr:two-component regulatory protein sensor kinase [Rhizobacter sp.]